MKPYLTKLIGSHQVSIIKGKRACDNAIIVQEVIKYIRNSKSKKGHMILKIYLEKVFDKLEWYFVHRTLNYFKFPPKIIKLIISCITTPNYTILVNGSKS